eukprot:697246-Prorocentrum_minimum.AAC.1
MQVHTWVCGAVRGARGSMRVRIWLSGADRGAHMAELSGQACNRGTKSAHIECTELTGVREGA